MAIVTVPFDIDTGTTGTFDITSSGFGRPDAVLLYSTKCDTAGVVKPESGFQHGLINNTAGNYVVGNQSRHVRLDNSITLTGEFRVVFKGIRQDSSLGTDLVNWIGQSSGTASRVYIWDSNHATAPDRVSVRINNSALNANNAMADVAIGEEFVIEIVRDAIDNIQLFVNGEQKGNATITFDWEIGCFGAANNGATNYTLPANAGIWDVSIEDYSSGDQYFWSLQEGSGTTATNRNPDTGSTYDGDWSESVVWDTIDTQAKIDSMSMSTRSQDGVATSNTAHWQKLTSCIAIPNLAGNGATYDAVFDSNITDGIRLNAITATGGPGNWKGYAVFFKGNIDEVNLFGVKMRHAVSSAIKYAHGDSQVDLLFAASNGTSAPSTFNTQAAMNQGFAFIDKNDTLKQGALTSFDKDNVATTLCYSIARNGKMIERLDTTGTSPLYNATCNSLGVGYAEVTQGVSLNTNYWYGLSISFTNRPDMEKVEDTTPTTAIDWDISTTIDPVAVFHLTGRPYSGYGTAEGNISNTSAWYDSTSGKTRAVTHAAQSNQSTESAKTYSLYSNEFEGLNGETQDTKSFRYGDPTVTAETEISYPRTASANRAFLSQHIFIGDTPVTEGPDDAVKKGTAAVTAVKYGTADVSAIYHGSTQVF